MQNAIQDSSSYQMASSKMFLLQTQLLGVDFRTVCQTIAFPPTFHKDGDYLF